VASHKVLQSVVRSVADMFTSTMNYVSDDYVMGHVLSAARLSRKATLEVDLLTGQATPPELLSDQVRVGIRRSVSDLPRLVKASGSDTTFVRAARLQVSFDITETAPNSPAVLTKAFPYVVSVTIEDDRGKTYEAVLNDSWAPDAASPISLSGLTPSGKATANPSLSNAVTSGDSLTGSRGVSAPNHLDRAPCCRCDEAGWSGRRRLATVVSVTCCRTQATIATSLGGARRSTSGRHQPSVQKWRSRCAYRR
jgi:hypothetical protein